MQKAYVVIVTLAVLCAAPALTADSRRALPRPPAGSPAGRTAMAPTPQIVKAIAVLHPQEGQSIHGTVTFTQDGNRVRVDADVQGLPPNSTHGFHIHEFGDCSAPDFASAGGHFNPEGHMHAGPETPMRHAGDLGNLEANAQGRATKQLVVDNITLGSGRDDILGRAVIVHANPDDLKTQPSGNAGGRIACGVIGVAKDGVLKTTARRPSQTSSVPVRH
jgi:superoxide dismutase, Cu-Zn family